MTTTKKTSRKVSRVAMAWHNGGLEFMFDNPPYDAELKDRLASICPGIEGSIDILRSKKYSDSEIETVFNACRAAMSNGTYGMICASVNLPKSIRVTVTVTAH